MEEQLSDQRCAWEYATRINEYKERGGYPGGASVARIISGWVIPKRTYDRLIQTLSGGERTGAGFARALSMESAVVTWGEATNHLLT